MDSGVRFSASSGEHKKPRRRGRSAAGILLGRLAAWFPQDHVGGAVFGRLFEFDEPAVDCEGSEFGRCELEVEVGLAA